LAREFSRERSDDPSYFSAHRYIDIIERRGVSMTFESWRRPLSAYTLALERGCFRIEAMREPRPDEAALAVAAELAKWREQPLFLHIRARWLAPPSG
jgi:hypothetical protein